MDNIDRLHQMLARIPLTDEEIAGSLQLSERGLERIAKKLGIDHQEVELLYAQLKTKLRGVDALTEDDGPEPRFSYETDFLENVTIRDAETGGEVFLQTTKASAFLNRVRSGEDEQAVMAQYAGLMTEGTDDKLHRAEMDKTGFWGARGAGCLIMARSTGRLLIAHRGPGPDLQEPNTWGTWGGALDRGEDPKTAVAREVHEETAYHGKIEEIIPLMVFKSGDFRYHNFLAIVAEEYDPHLDWENQGYRWVEFGKWPRPLHFGLKALLGDQHSMQIVQDKATSREIDEDEHDDGFRSSDSFDDEIDAKSGTFNFNWSLGGKHGFGTAKFSGRGPKMTVLVVRATDMSGQEIDYRSFAGELANQAKAFIGKE